MIDYKKYYVWGWTEDGKYQANKILDELPSKAVIFAPEEFELYHGWHNGLLNGIDLTVVLGSSSLNYYLTDYRNQSVPLTANIILWDTYWFNLTYLSMKDKLSLTPLTTIDKLYISLNFKPHAHRCQLLDNLYHNNLLEHGHVTWHDTDPTSLYMLSNDYQWKYWKPTVLELDTDFYTDQQIHPYSLPPEYGSTLINVITETTTRTTFITEKTVTAILLNKPFIVLGAKGFHNELVKLGFELYDELFDYSFDNIEDVEQRMQAIIDNLNKLKNQNYSELRNLVHTKTERNKQRAIDIATDRKYIPEFMINYISTLKNNESIVVGRDPTYLDLEKLLLN